MSAQVSPTPPHGGGPSNPDRVIAHAHADGRLAITLPSLLVSDLDPLEDWWLLGRVQMRTDLPGELKINVIAHHRHTGQLVRASMSHPQHPDGLDPLDYSSDPEDLPGYAAWQQQWDQEAAARRYKTDKPLWDKLSALPEITDVFIGTLEGFELTGGSLAIPYLNPDTDVLTSALAYASSGWFVLPVRTDTRHAGSLVGKSWPEKSTQDPKQIVAWFAGAEYGIALHVNKSGAIVLDIDKPDKFPQHMWAHLATARVQQTRPDADPRRGHYVFANPGGTYANSSTGIGIGWGDVRASANGIIIAAPGIGERRWASSGPVQPCPDAILARLRQSDTVTAESVPDDVVRAFVERYSQRPTIRPDIAARWATRFTTRAVIGSDSRHTTMLGILPEVFRVSRMGRVNARQELNKLYALWAKAVVGADRNGVTATEESAMSEFLQMCAWALAQSSLERS